MIPTYNRLQFLPKTLDSVYRQTIADFDVVIFDDGSTDGTREWIKARGFPRLRYARREGRRGAGAARNAALRRAKGEFLAFLDSDDTWEPSYLETMVAALENGPAVAACCDMNLIDSRDRLIMRDYLRNGSPSRPQNLLGLPFFPMLGATVMRRSALPTVGRFDETFRRVCDDWDFLCRMARRHGESSFRMIPRSLASYRRHGGQSTADLAPAVERERLLDFAYWFHVGQRRAER
jgi:glycosyltransferase involved in cell wall biosynthesis